MNLTATIADRNRAASGRSSDLRARIDQAIRWWGEHRAWPANEPARIEPDRR